MYSSSDPSLKLEIMMEVFYSILLSSTPHAFLTYFYHSFIYQLHVPPIPTATAFVHTLIINKSLLGFPICNCFPRFSLVNL